MYRYSLRTLIVVMLLGGPLWRVGVEYWCVRLGKVSSASKWTTVGGPGAISEFSTTTDCFFRSRNR